MPLNQSKPYHSLNGLRDALFVADGCIVLNVAYRYEIPLERCRTHEDVLAWTHHICEKVWASPDLVRRFIEVARSEAGLTLNMP